MDNMNTKLATKELPDGFHAHKVCLVNADGSYPQAGGSNVVVTNFPATQPVSIAASVGVTGTFWQTTQPVSGTVTITPPALTKGAQGATGVSTQDLKDAGRVRVTLFATGIAAGATGVETMVTLNKVADNTGSAASSFVVTSGKRFRIESISFASRGHATATAQVTTFTLRTNAGPVAVGSQALLSIRTATPATASAWDRCPVVIPDGYEIAGDGTLQIGVSANAVFVTNAPTWDVTIIGYEY